MTWTRMYSDNVRRYDWRNWTIEKHRRLPFAPWDVIRWTPQSDGVTRSGKRYAGGFFTKRAAQNWAENEQKLYERT